ncbi:hypothetical protein B0H13DRAFT_1888741 [Mycena leptocephala]|nr:hypothetical protein B0H13DRAFT_1888741 [Mycena leptocephala]
MHKPGSGGRLSLSLLALPISLELSWDPERLIRPDPTRLGKILSKTVQSQSHSKTHKMGKEFCEGTNNKYPVEDRRVSKESQLHDSKLASAKLRVANWWHNTSLNAAEDLPDVPRPCNYFDLIGGTNCVRLIALMLGRLRMSVKDAVKAYGELSKEVFSDVKSQGSDGRFKASKLEKAIKGMWALIPRHRTQRREWKILERTLANAGRATSAAPTFFKQFNWISWN